MTSLCRPPVKIGVRIGALIVATTFSVPPPPKLNMPSVKGQSWGAEFWGDLELKVRVGVRTSFRVRVRVRGMSSGKT